MEWLPLWKPPARDQYGLWAGVAATLVAVGLTLLFTESLRSLVLAFAVLCVGAAVYVFLAIFVGLPLPPTHADWDACKKRYIDFMQLRGGLHEVADELDAAAGQLGRDLGNGMYSGVQPRQDKYEATIKNDPVFADVRDVIESAHKEIGSYSQRSYAAATHRSGRAENSITRNPGSSRRRRAGSKGHREEAV